MGKIYLIVLDGAADRRIDVLGNKTPLMVADKPVLDAFSVKGQQSLIEILPKGFVPESDSGAMALLGYDPMQYYCGRGMLESLGVGRGLQYKYRAGFRINFASMHGKSGILDRRVARGLSDEELKELAHEIEMGVVLKQYPDVKFDLYVFGAFRGILSFYSDSTILSGNVSNTDPAYRKEGFFSFPIAGFPHEIMPCMALDASQAAKTTADIVNIFTRQCSRILCESRINKKRIQEGKIPANGILVRDGGSSQRNFPKVIEKYGKTVSIYGQLPCEKAMACLMGAQFFYSQSFEQQMDGAYLEDLARELCEDKSDIVFCHLKGPDEPGHDGKPLKKVEAIEKIDKYFFSQMKRQISEEDILAVTCDHATPCELGLHSDDQVPLLLSGRGIPQDGLTFDEENAGKGSCPVKKAIQIIDHINGGF